MLGSDKQRFSLPSLSMRFLLSTMPVCGLIIGLTPPALAVAPAPFVMPNLTPKTSLGLDSLAFVASDDVDGTTATFWTLSLQPRLTIRPLAGLGLFAGLGGTVGLLGSEAKDTAPIVGYLNPIVGATFARALGPFTLGADVLYATPLHKDGEHDGLGINWSPGDSCPTSTRGRCLRGALDLRFDQETFFVQAQLGAEFYKLDYNEPVMGRLGLATGIALGQGTWWGIAELAGVAGLRQAPAGGGQLDLGLARATGNRLAFRLSVPIYPRSNGCHIEVPIFMLGISAALGSDK
jgi:hypothetical protein